MSNHKRISRRAFIGKTAAGAAGLALGGGVFNIGRRARAADGSQPNIVCIIADEHNASVTGCYGNSIVQTPHIDSLAANGVAFDQFYTTSPLCVPMRLSFTSCKYISRVGGWNNDCRLPSNEYPSLPYILNDAGYQSYLCGKMHYDKTHRYGFTELYQANNNTMNGKVSRRNPSSGSSGQLSNRFDDFHTGDTSSVMTHDLSVTQHAVDFLNARDPAGPPFFLLCGYLAPHFPLIVPQAYYDRYKDLVPMPVIPPGHLDALTLNYKQLRYGFQVDLVDDATVKLGRELYYGLTNWLDDQVGQVLAALAARPFAENTVIVYTADHGENMGEHGMWWKNCEFEHAARVPCIVNWPQRWSGARIGHRTGACSIVDLVQTIAAVGGAQIPDDWDGDPMTDWLDDPGAAWKNFALSEYYAHNIASGYVMTRKDQWKYVYHTRMNDTYGPERELYNLSLDPGEFTNLARAAGHEQQVAAMHQAMLDELERDPDETEQIARTMGAVGYT